MTVVVEVGHCRPARAGNRRQSEGINLVVSGIVNSAASDNPRVPFPRGGHQIIGSATSVNHSPGFSLTCVQQLVASATSYPADCVIGPVRRRNKNRNYTAPSYPP